MLFINRLTIQETCRLTNTTYPVQSYLTTETFPSQDSDKLLTEQEVNVRSYKTAIYKDDSYPYLSVTYKVLRWDNEYPYITIGITVGDNSNPNKGMIIKFNNHAINQLNNSISEADFEIIALYPVQKYNYYLIPTRILYSDFSNLADATHGTIVRCDDAEPALAIIAEITNDGKLRFLVSDEAICLMDDFAPKTVQYNEIDVYDFIEQLLGEYELYDR